MVPHQSSDSVGDRQPGRPRQEAQIPAMISASGDRLSYDPYVVHQQQHQQKFLPANIASQRGGGHISSNIGSFQSADHTLLADYMRQAQEVSRVFNLFQQDLSSRNHSYAVPSSPSVPTPPTAFTFHNSDLIDLSHSMAPPSQCRSHPSTGSSKYVGYPFSSPFVRPHSDHFASQHHQHQYPMPGRPDTSGFPGSQSSIVRDDSATTSYTQGEGYHQRESPSYSQNDGQTAVQSDNHLHISEFLHPTESESIASPSMPALTTPLSAVSSSSASTYQPTLADVIDELTLSDYTTGDADIFGEAPAIPSSVTSGLTVPQTGRGITRAPLHPLDRGMYTRHFFPPQIPSESIS
jgi:hypothetical protein